VAQVVEHLRSKYEALNSNPSTTKNKKSNQQNISGEGPRREWVVGQISGFCLLVPGEDRCGPGRRYLPLFLGSDRSSLHSPAMHHSPWLRNSPGIVFRD
jgi:hypothetical protein